jgi:hypothetical protein
MYRNNYTKQIYEPLIFLMEGQNHAPKEVFLTISLFEVKSGQIITY